VKRLPVDRRRKNGMPVFRRVMLRVARIPHAVETTYCRIGIRAMRNIMRRRNGMPVLRRRSTDSRFSGA